MLLCKNLAKDINHRSLSLIKYSQALLSQSGSCPITEQSTSTCCKIHPPSWMCGENSWLMSNLLEQIMSSFYYCCGVSDKENSNIPKKNSMKIQMMAWKLWRVSILLRVSLAAAGLYVRMGILLYKDSTATHCFWRRFCCCCLYDSMVCCGRNCMSSRDSLIFTKIS